MEIPNVGKMGEDPITVAAIILIVSTVTGFFLLGGGDETEPVVTTPYDGGNFSTDIGTPVRVNFFVSNPSKDSIEVDIDKSELKFDSDWNFWERPDYHTENRVSLTGENNQSMLEIPSGETRYISAKFVTPLQEGVYEVELIGVTEDDEFSKKVAVAVENRSSSDTSTE